MRPRTRPLLEFYHVFILRIGGLNNWGSGSDSGFSVKMWLFLNAVVFDSLCFDDSFRIWQCGLRMCCRLRRLGANFYNDFQTSSNVENRVFLTNLTGLTSCYLVTQLFDLNSPSGHGARSVDGGQLDHKRSLKI